MLLCFKEKLASLIRPSRFFEQFRRERSTSAPTRFFFCEDMFVALSKISVTRKSPKSASYRKKVCTRHKIQVGRNWVEADMLRSCLSCSRLYVSFSCQERFLPTGRACFHQDLVSALLFDNNVNTTISSTGDDDSMFSETFLHRGKWGGGPQCTDHEGLQRRY